MGYGYGLLWVSWSVGSVIVIVIVIVSYYLPWYYLLLITRIDVAHTPIDTTYNI